jgi:hypothetical protein
MSGPVTAEDTAGQERPAGTPVFELSDSRLTEVGGLPVHRALPRHGRRTVGAWCFLDHFGPLDVSPQRTMTVGPHPHIGLHTVTWLLSGEVEHSDSLGNEQVIRPGHLNLMTAGHGIAHAEDARRQTSGAMEGVQFWVAQPEATRNGPSAFAHHEDLPTLHLPAGQATVFLGAFGGVTSPAQLDSALMGVDLMVHGALDLSLDPSFEYAIALLHGDLRVDGQSMAANQLAYVGSGRISLQLDTGSEARLLLLGGEPFESEILMWWNFVARTREEMEQAQEDWATGSDRFAPVASTLERIEAPRPFWR